MNAWFEGYPLGVQAAEQDGVGHWGNVATGFQHQVPAPLPSSAAPGAAEPVEGVKSGADKASEELADPVPLPRPTVPSPELAVPLSGPGPVVPAPGAPAAGVPAFQNAIPGIEPVQPALVPEL